MINFVRRLFGRQPQIKGAAPMHGRETFGDHMPVALYRLMQTSFLATIEEDGGREAARATLKRAGYISGEKLVESLLDLTLPMEDFVAHLQETLIEHKIGFLEIDGFDPITKKIALTIREDLDCSGEACTFETLCMYDEGLLEAIFNRYTGEPYEVVETECWGTGQPHCKFEGAVVFD
jgi:predicted hydrocarbon binding protein